MNRHFLFKIRNVRITISLYIVNLLIIASGETKVFSKIKLLVIILLLIISCDSEGNNSEANLFSNRKIYTDSRTENIKKSATYDSISNSRRNAITRVVEIVSSAIVGINVTEVVEVQYRDPFFDDPLFKYFFGERAPRYKQYEVRGVGSGFIISPDGYILTNHHVAGNATKIVVTTTDGKTHDAEIIGSDQISDVALIKIKGGNLPYLKFSNSDDIIIGEWVIAFGNPFGLFETNSKPTVTVGVVSNSGVSFHHEDRIFTGRSYISKYRVYKDMIQTDAAISSGNSGGPLVNSLGEVIGVNTVIKSTAQTREGAGSIGIGFAIPINRVKKILDILVEKGSVNRDYIIGMEVKKNDERIARYFNLKTTEGMVVTSVMHHSPAMKAGIEPGDIILKIDDKAIVREEDYLISILDSMVGDKLKCEILRDDKTIYRTIELISARR